MDDMAVIVRKLNETQKSGSDVQQQAVEQMLPLVRELSENTTAAIQDPEQIRTGHLRILGNT